MFESMFITVYHMRGGGGWTINVVCMGGWERLSSGMSKEVGVRTLQRSCVECEGGCTRHVQRVMRMC